MAIAVCAFGPVEGFDEVLGLGLAKVIWLGFAGCGNDEAVRGQIDEKVDEVSSFGDTASVPPGNYWEEDAFGEFFGGVN